ncbi:hypothetical protein CVN76_18940 [Bacillus sp. mrc49]|nr:hypothetical protein CVN76_18940 [Bacillus sp. mrc49]
MTNFIAAKEVGALCPAFFMFSKAFYKENPEVGRINSSGVGKMANTDKVIPCNTEIAAKTTRIFENRIKSCEGSRVVTQWRKMLWWMDEVRKHGEKK